jgi:hypothetical protein
VEAAVRLVLRFGTGLLDDGIIEDDVTAVERVRMSVLVRIGERVAMSLQARRATNDQGQRDQRRCYPRHACMATQPMAAVLSSHHPSMPQGAARIQAASFRPVAHAHRPPRFPRPGYSTEQIPLSPLGSV